MSWEQYSLLLTDDGGVPITDPLGRTAAIKALWMEYGFMANDVGWLRMGLPTSFDINVLAPDRIVQVWRAPPGGQIRLMNAYFIRYWRFETQGTIDTIEIAAADPNYLLSSRVIAYPTGTIQSDKADNADAAMKEFVDENLVTDTSVPDAGDRDLADLRVQVTSTDGPILTSVAGENILLDELRKWAKASREEGTEVFFNVAVDAVTSTSINFVFRTKTGQPGQDLTGLGVVFSQERGNLENPFLEWDYRESANYVYGLGQGEGDNRNVQQAYDAARYNASRYARREATADARKQDEDDGVREVARARLEAGRPKRRFGADLVDIAGFRFGSDWNFGDKARARYRNQEFDGIVRQAVVQVDGRGRERIRARLEWES